MLVGIMLKLSSHRAPWLGIHCPSPCRHRRCRPLNHSHVELFGFQIAGAVQFRHLLHCQRLRPLHESNGLVGDTFDGGCTTHFFGVLWISVILYVVRIRGKL